ncbi:branched-chain amino acid ABC transporter permease [Parvibaculum sp.]|uniref:branched-chain amino acid ABC transporter permease n=1 Tax=Parvibaculum sp. TaxID=2024848 RepID=UPI001DE9CA76|nr:branched-chain amino acid ABC transporter permease [Parvibaculum sp.]MBX3491232.1 branched-chain amino acid ABC transporter permease [Parvibaculum sp.]MBX3491270.1 branched-chain amino acid ABC transporter permease [Parvibaculum sp.]
MPASALKAKSVTGLTTFDTELVRIAAVAIVLLGCTWLLSGQPFYMNILSYTFLFAALATSWNIIGGYGGQFSLAHGVYFAIGAYLAGNLYIRFGLSPWIALVPAALAAAIAAALICWPLFRLKGKFFGIATLAVSEVAFVLANYFDSLTGGPRGMSLPFKAGFSNMIFTNRFSYALLMLGFLIFCLIVSGFVYRTRLGYYLQAVRDDQDAAQASGIDVLYVKMTGMALSAALTAMGGVFFALYLRFIDPPTLLSLPDIGVRFLLISLIGGVGTLFGPLVGALLIVPVEFYLRATIGGSIPGGHLVVLGAVLILCSLFLKRGIVGAAETAWQSIRRRRHG